MSPHRSHTPLCTAGAGAEGTARSSHLPASQTPAAEGEVDVVGDADPYVSIVFQHRFGSGARHIHGPLQAGAFGRPLVAHCQTTWYRDRAHYGVPWRGRWATEGGGPATGHGIHQTDLLLDLMGPRAEVRGMAARLAHDVETEDVSTAQVRFADGAVATVATRRFLELRKAPRTAGRSRWRRSGEPPPRWCGPGSRTGNSGGVMVRTPPRRRPGRSSQQCAARTNGIWPRPG